MPAPKEKPFDALRHQLRYANEQTAIWKNKAKSEEDRARDLEERNGSNERAMKNLREQLTRMTERLGVEFGKVELRETALVQLALRIAPYGDPATPELGLVASTAPQGGG